MEDIIPLIEACENALEHLNITRKKTKEIMRALFLAVEESMTGRLAAEEAFERGDWEALLSLIKTGTQKAKKYTKWMASLTRSEMEKSIMLLEMESVRLAEDEQIIEELPKGADVYKHDVDFCPWFIANSPHFSPENGHASWGRKLGETCVFHSAKSNNQGLQQMAWEKVGRHWEWMASRTGGFLQAGSELCLIGQEQLGTILLQHGHKSKVELAHKLALYGDEELGLELRELLGMEPICGGVDIGQAPALLSTSSGAKDVKAMIHAPGKKKNSGCMYLSSRHDNEIVLVRDMDSGEIEHRFYAHSDPVRSLALSPDGATLASGSEDQTIRIWHVNENTGALSASQALLGHEGEVRGLEFLDNDTLVSCAEGHMFGEGMAVVWTKEGSGNWKEIRTMTGDNRHSNCLKLMVHPETGRALVCNGYASSHIFVWDLLTGEQVALLKGHDESVYGLTLCHDGRLASCSLDGSVILWDLQAGSHQRISVADTWLYDIVTLSSGILAATTDEGAIRLLDVSPNSNDLVGGIQTGSDALCLLPLADGRLLSGGSLLQIWDPTRAAAASPITSDFRSATLLTDGRPLVGDIGYGVTVWSPPMEGRAMTVVSHVGVVDENSKRLEAAVAVNGGAVLVREYRNEYRNGAEVWMEEALGWQKRLSVPGTVSGIVGLGGSFAVADFNRNTVTVWDATSLEIVFEFNSLVEGPRFLLHAGDDWIGLLGDGNEGNVALMNCTTGEEKSLPLASSLPGVPHSCAFVGAGTLAICDPTLGLAVVDSEQVRVLCSEVTGIEVALGFTGRLLVQLRVQTRPEDGDDEERSDSRLILAIYDVFTEQVVGEIRGIDLDRVVSTCWDAERKRIAVFEDREISFFNCHHL